MFKLIFSLYALLVAEKPLLFFLFQDYQIAINNQSLKNIPMKNNNEKYLQRSAEGIYTYFGLQNQCELNFPIREKSYESTEIMQLVDRKEKK